jgi:hypothetical protein
MKETHGFAMLPKAACVAKLCVPSGLREEKMTAPKLIWWRQAHRRSMKISISPSAAGARPSLVKLPSLDVMKL